MTKVTRPSAGASVPDQALAVPVEPVARLDPAGFDPSREKAAFMAGWLTRHSRSDAAPEEAWIIYLDAQEAF